MIHKTKIVIAGIGGVGGYFGGLLARAYAGNDDIEVHFIARGEHLKAIKANGLNVIKGDIDFIATPFLATDDAREIGIADYIIICTKSYDLTAMLDQLKPCIGTETVLLPLLNGVEAVEKIRAQFPNHLVPAGCAYIVSAIKEPGVVENMGNRQEIYFGLDAESDERLSKLEDLFKAAGVEATLSEEISQLIWQKFIFLSCIATATSFYEKPVGQLLKENSAELRTFIDETSALAKAKNIEVDPSTADKAMAHYESLPFATTSSMQRDFQFKRKNTELESITGYVVRQGKDLGIPTPHFEAAYQELLIR
ncbi:ketopantoate reductase family protein [Pedobacter boryungensis]|uniref:2-dehydropantoate 2-reductase n=1 Tax=Pedobacter boryungensis TaxID=869962 RepID=A0ABX2DFY3_9SPHI|nr:2-dehydropantoate 2-reductase [Pedobacter boryungensis]NQX33014.1 2-dehydropantoate 2-reductase [Pedobacter boryungensis]